MIGLLLQEATIVLVGKKMEGRDEIRDSHCRRHREKLSESRNKGKAVRDDFVLSHLEIGEF